jgi:hypothetical protein
LSEGKNINADYILYNAYGQQVDSFRGNNRRKIARDVSSLSTGVYYLVVTIKSKEKNKWKTVKKLVIN